MKKLGLAVVVVMTMVVGLVGKADAFCGFYVSGGDQQMFNDATQVVMMRMGTRTVLAMQNNYKGPPQDFAMVIPVPTVLHEGDVKTLTKDVFEHVEKMSAPRLVEYWEQDPCRQDVYPDRRPMTAMAPSAGMARAESKSADDLGVRIEAKFVVGEYQIVILSAKDSTGLATWLGQEKYKIPDGAAPLLRPYVEAGMKFFVAKVDPQKVKFEGGRAALSPLRFHYDSDEFALPIRLGLANSSGTQDLIVNILAPHQRYEVANYKNVTIPTNIDVSEGMKDKFASFYTALYDRTIEKNPGAVVTEYAWQATTCDPCPGPALNYQEFSTLGADVLGGTADKPTAYGGYDFVLTRLHARYGKEISDDLRFKEAGGIVGGREFLKAGQTANPVGKLIDSVRPALEEGAQPAGVNNFQGRYAVRHEWTGAIACPNPVRYRWGGPPMEVTSRPDYKPTGIEPATGLAFAPRNAVVLADAVQRDVPEIDLKMKAAAVIAAPTGGSGMAPTVAAAGSGSGSAVLFNEPDPNALGGGKKKGGCGCETGGSDPAGVLAILGALGFVARRRRGCARS